MISLFEKDQRVLMRFGSVMVLRRMKVRRTRLPERQGYINYKENSISAGAYSINFYHLLIVVLKWIPVCVYMYIVQCL